MARLAWLVAGLAGLFVGAIGVVVPLLPTTPFVILAAFCFGKSSPTLQRWLEQNRTFGPMIADWRTNGAIAAKYKLVALVMMTSVVGISLFMGLSQTIVTVQIICVIGAALFILTRPNGPSGNAFPQETPPRACIQDLPDQFQLDPALHDLHHTSHDAGPSSP